jgi:hypothetical protein
MRQLQNLITNNQDYQPIVFNVIGLTLSNGRQPVLITIFSRYQQDTKSTIALPVIKAMFLNHFRPNVTVAIRQIFSRQPIQNTINPIFQRSVRNVIQQIPIGNLPDLTYMMLVISLFTLENIKENGKAALIVISNLIIIPLSVASIATNTTDQRWMKSIRA